MFSRIKSVFNRASFSPNYPKYNSGQLSDGFNQPYERLVEIRTLARNNPYVRRFLQLNQDHVVGPHGVRLFVDGGVPKRQLKRLQSRWDEYSMSVTPDGKSLRKLQQRCVVSLLRDGEVMLQAVSVEGGEKYWVRDVINCEVGRNEESKNVFDSIKFNTTTGAPEEYIFRGTLAGVPENVPASDMLHLYRDDHTAYRGVSWLSNVYQDLKRLQMLEEAYIIGMRMLADAPYLYGIDRAGLNNIINKDRVEGETDAQRQARQQANMDAMFSKAMSVKPGDKVTIPKDVEVHKLDTPFDGASFVDAKNSAIASISAGLGISHFALSGDSGGGGNYPTLRASRLNDKAFYDGVRSYIEDINVWVFIRWYLMQEDNVLFMPSRLPNMVLRHDGPVLPNLDPAREADAIAKLVAEGVYSRRQGMRVAGVDPDQMMQEIEEDAAMLAAGEDSA